MYWVDHEGKDRKKGDKEANDDVEDLAAAEVVGDVGENHGRKHGRGQHHPNLNEGDHFGARAFGSDDDGIF